MDYSEKWGKDVDEAVRLALLELKLPIEEVDVTVLEESSKGFFGLGSKLAKVRVEKKKAVQPERATKKKTEPEREVRETKETREPVKQEKRVEKQKPVEKAEKQEPQKKYEKIERAKPENLVEINDHPALTFIVELTKKMDLEVSVKAMKNDESVYITMEGKDSGTIIGKRGQTLDSIQYLTSLVMNKDKEQHVRVVVDAENYRSKREKTLEQLADRLAGKVTKTKKTVRLEPMNPYERKVIHARLQDNGKVITKSEGEEPYRRVVIELK
ncbi:MAG: protein jag [Clostridiales bacterium]|nr:protein jag [Clostridiales bacterium]